MKKLIKISFLFVAILCMTSTLQAQNFAYVFSNQILAEFPETKVADSNLKTLQAQLQKKFEGMVTTAQAKAQKFQADFAAGLLSPQQQQEAQATMEAEQKKIAAFQDDTKNKLLKKEKELFDPIMQKINKAIEDVAKEDGLTMVFNADMQILLYADESTNVTDKVKAKLGML